MAPASSAARISSGVSTTLFSGVCWFVLFFFGFCGLYRRCFRVLGSKLRRLRLQGGHSRFLLCKTVSVTAAVLSSGCAASASGAPIEKVIAAARTAARTAF